MGSSRREDVIHEEVFDEATEKPITIEELEAEIEEELKKQEDENPFKIDLQELNSLQEDIGEEKKMKNVQMDLSQFKKEKKSIFDKALDSARKREGNLKYNTSRRDEEAIELAKEAMTLLSNKISGPVSSPSKSSIGRGRTGRGRDGKQIKKTSSTKLKTGSSPYLQKRSKSAPVKKKSSITIHPYREAPCDTRDRNVPSWRPLTRMEAYTGRGLYSNHRPKNNAQEKYSPPKFEDRKPQITPKSVKELTTIHFDKPKVRTVEEILEQTRVIINPQEDFNRPEIFRPEENKNHENAFDKNRHEDREFGREKDVYEYENHPPPPKISRSQSLESGLSEMNSLLDEIDKEHEKYCKGLIEIEPVEAILR